MLREVPHHLIVLFLRNLAPGVPLPQDVVALVPRPISSTVVPPAPSPRPEEPPGGPEEREEQEDPPEPEEREPERTRRTGRRHADDQPHDEYDREDPRQQEQRRPTPHAIRPLNLHVHVLPRPDGACTAVAHEVVGGMPRGVPSPRRERPRRSHRPMHRGPRVRGRSKSSRTARFDIGPLLSRARLLGSRNSRRTGGGSPEVLPSVALCAKAHAEGGGPEPAWRTRSTRRG